MRISEVRTPPLAVLASLLLGTACGGPAQTSLVASGTTEVVETDVAALVPARVIQLRVNEGDMVRAGDTLALLSQSTLASDIDIRRARVAASAAALRDLEAGARPEEIARVEAELRTAESDIERTRRDLERAEAMLQAQAISQAQLDAARTAASTAVSRRDAVSESLKLLQAGTREARIAAARADVTAARASLNAALATSADLVLTAPVDGRVLARYVELGEVLAAGIPALSIGDPQKPWVRVFVAAPALSALRVGQDALAQVQGSTDQLFAGRIIAIDTKAQFTPRIALTEDERADLMFGVKVELANPTATLKPGLPVDVHFDTAGTGFPDALTKGRTIHRLPGADATADAPSARAGGAGSGG